MTTLAEIIPLKRPACWTHELVKQRILDAFATLRRMPGQALQRVQSAWLMPSVHGFEDMVHWEAGEANARVLERWEAARGASAAEVSRMEEALGWLSWLGDRDERIYLQAWAFACAYGRKQSSIMRKRGISKTRFYAIVKRAAQRITDRLNREGVQVR